MADIGLPVRIFADSHSRWWAGATAPRARLSRRENGAKKGRPALVTLAPPAFGKDQ